MDGFGPELCEQQGEVSRLVTDGEDHNISNYQMNLKRFDLHIEGVQLLSDQNLKLTPGHRYGLIGCNGVGKTTLLRHLAAKKITCQWQEHVHSLLVTEPPPITEENLSGLESEQTPIETVLRGYSEESYEEGKHESSENYQRDRAFHECVSLQGGFESAKALGMKFLSKLGISKKQSESSPLHTLSGGFRMRVALAAALLVEPQLLLLDEVTNHLDTQTSDWLSDYLSTYKYTLVIVTHDTNSLNEICTDTIHMKDKQLTQYQGNFDSFMLSRSELLKKQFRLNNTHEKSKERLEKTIEYLERTQDGKGVGRHKKKADRLGAERTITGRRWKWSVMGDRVIVPSVVEDKEISFKIRSDKRLSDLLDGSVLCRANKVTAGYDTDPKPVLKNVSFEILKGQKIGIIGPNGTGKSTFLSVLDSSLEECSPYPVDWIFGSDTRVKYYRQDHILLLDKLETPIEYLTRTNKGLRSEEASDFLMKYDLTFEQCGLQFKLLSAGQRSKVILAGCFICRPTVLLLDEPTNHMDFASQMALVDALESSTVTLVIVTHSESLLNSVCDKLYEIKNSSLEEVNETFSNWRKKQLQSVNAIETIQTTTTIAPKPFIPKPVTGPAPPGPLKTSSVKCRLCKGAHFTHQCSLKKKEDIKLKSKEMEQKMQEIGDAKAAKAALASLKYKDRDGIWNVAVDKKTRSLLKKC